MPGENLAQLGRMYKATQEPRHLAIRGNQEGMMLEMDDGGGPKDYLGGEIQRTWWRIPYE